VPAAIPTGAPDTDRPINLSALLVLHSSTRPAQCHPAHTSDTTAPAVVDQLLVEVHAIRQERISKGTLVLVEAYRFGAWSIQKPTLTRSAEGTV
jgi:hypothetical protein